MYDITHTHNHAHMHACLSPTACLSYNHNIIKFLVGADIIIAPTQNHCKGLDYIIKLCTLLGL